jgi:hypothetical protein
MKLLFSAALLVMAACASSKPSNVETSTAAPVEKKVECDLVCERAELAVKPAAEADYSVKALANANAILESMHPAMLACYKKRVAVSPNAHAFITVDIVIGPDGKVAAVETTGGALLGEGTMSCIVDQIRQATFDKPHNGGTLRIHVPFSLRRVAAGDDT